MKSFKEFEVWQKGIMLVREIYRITEKFPSKELYGLTSQMRRSSIAVPSNIAEGFRRKYPKEFKRFLDIARGSLAELETQLIISKELLYMTKNEEIGNIEEMIDHISRMLNNLSQHLSHRTPNAELRTPNAEQ